MKKTFLTLTFASLLLLSCGGKEPGSAVTPDKPSTPSTPSTPTEPQKPLTLAELITKGVKFDVSMEKVCHCPKDDEDSSILVAQGAGTDGNYFYFVLKDAKDTKSRLYKYDLEGKLVLKSEIFQGNHSNDLTVDTKNGRVVLVRGTGAPKKLALFDCKQLKFQKDVTVGRGVGALAYNAKRNAYAGSQGGKVIFYLTSDFQYDSARDYSRNDPAELSSFTAQGMGCDFNWCYFPMSPTGSTKHNVVVVYDWNGKYKTYFTLPTAAESESLFEWNGEYYVNFFESNNGATLYKLSFTEKK